MATSISLDKIQPGISATISKITASGMIRQRLMDMGILVGDKITVTKIAPLGDPIEIRVKNYALSLRKQEAAQIQLSC